MIYKNAKYYTLLQSCIHDMYHICLFIYLFIFTVLRDYMGFHVQNIQNEQCISETDV